MKINHITEKWSQKYKRSIDCSNPKGFSQKAHCAGRKKKKNESIRESYEIEFVCVNPNFCDATEQKNQDKLFQALRSVPGIIVYKQDFDAHNSMAAIIKDEANTDAPKLIQKLAQQHKVAIDLENDVSQGMMDDIVSGRLEGLTDYYDTDSKNESIPSPDKMGKPTLPSLQNTIQDLNDLIKDLDKGKPQPKEIILDPEDYKEKYKKFKQQGKPYMITKVQEDTANDKVMELLLDNIGAGPFDGGCVIVAQALQIIHGGEIMALVRPDGIADHAVVQKGNTMYDFDGPGTPEEVISRFEKNEGARITDVRKLRMTDLTDAPRNTKLAKQIAIIMQEINVTESKEIRTQKRKDGFTIDLYIDNKHVGQYTHTREDDIVRNFAEIFPEYRNKGYGTMLLLAAIKTADDMGMDFEEDTQSLTPAMSRLYDELSDSGLIYGGGGVWTVSPSGENELEDFLNESAKVDEGVNDPHIFKAVFMAGGPGSGKSFVAQNILGGTGLRAVNSDEVYEFLLKRQGLSLDPDTIASTQGQEIRGTAKDLTAKRQQNYIDGRIGLLIDGTGKNVSVIQDLAQKLKSIGYSVSMIFVNTSLEVAQQRNRQRDRVLPAKLVADSWNEVQQNLMKYQQIFGADRFHIVDNSGGLEDLDRQKNFDKVYNEVQRFLNTPPKHKKALAWIQNQKAQNNAKPTTNSRKSDGGVTSTN